MKIDVVCNKAVDEAQAEIKQLWSEREGQKFFFCCVECKETFDMTPGCFSQVMPHQGFGDCGGPEGRFIR
jgi:YHS domain-containing protein